MKKISFICKDGLENFLIDLCNELAAHYEVKLFLVPKQLNQFAIDEAIRWGDILWFEWADEVAIYGSRSPIVRHKPSVVRLHSYEAFTGMPKTIDWTAINKLVLVSDFMKDILAMSVPSVMSNVPHTLTIPNGVNLGRFTFGKHGTGHNIAWVGYINSKKNLPMALQIIKRLVEHDKRYVLHIAGNFQELPHEVYAKYFIMNNNLSDNVIFSGWVGDINEWLEDKDYILHTSIHESFGYAIAEAMAKGIKPVVHEYRGAYDTWPAGNLFFDIDDAVRLIMADKYESSAYRQFVEDRYSLDRQVEATRAMLEGLL